ncbi:MAG TPA: beta-1,6-N-acetylglucosaminyltransferase [Paracoccus sp. (in: a-proteobacteria)]|nr:beta-1,6-N-acetylglucosaminyltransferase [Paracoccus sp. (in: a-proteobacteria)]
MRLGVVMLCHDNLPLAARLARLWADSGAAVAIHVDARCGAPAVAALWEGLAGTGALPVPRRSCEWGTFSLVAATLDAAQALLAAHDDLTHVITVSGSCLPLRPPAELLAWLARHPGCDFIESVNALDVGWSVGGLNEERFTLHFPFSFRRQRRLFDRYVQLQRRFGIRRRIPEGLVPHLGSQWWCLTATTLRAILADPRRGEFDRYFRYVWIPDESYFQTLVRRHSLQVESRSLTVSKFDTQGKPYVFYDDHRDLLAASHGFIARKIWPGAAGLYAHFPRPSQDPATEPDPERVEAVLEAAAIRRQLGRPGLYMQSRFPAKDRENGKTAAPYAVMYGLGDLFPGLGDWLAACAGIAAHGHLFARDEAEFADGASIGPGALSASAAIRDLDPQGFLASLIRSSPDVVGFLYSPRDRQELNWFMATDPNARLYVVTGAWMLPLLHSGMPFDDVRRMAARIQRAEIAFLDILDSVWVKGRVRRWTLADVIADPAGVLETIRLDLAPDNGPACPLPSLRDVTGLVALLRRLRNAGLRPRRMGDHRKLRALTTPPAAQTATPKGPAT